MSLFLLQLLKILKTKTNKAKFYVVRLLKQQNPALRGFVLVSFICYEKTNYRLLPCRAQASHLAALRLSQ